MRVISGLAKGRRLRAVPGDSTRPITDRVKEALFDIIGADVAGSNWWDAFAGTGAVAIEALSRGAAFARLTDTARPALETINLNLKVTGLAASSEVRRTDAFAALSESVDRNFDYIYVAPPQYKGFWARALSAIDSRMGWVANDGWIIVQLDPKEDQRLVLTHLEEFDRRRYGSTLLLFYRSRD